MNLIVNNSTSQVTGFSREQFSILKDLLSYRVDNYFGGSLRFSTKSLIDKKGYFPTGLLYIVDAYVKSNNIPINIKDNRKQLNTARIDLKASFDYKPYKVQIEAVKAFKSKSRGIIVAPTGTGKSTIIALVISELKVSTLIVVPSLELKSQLTQVLCKVFDPELVGTIKNKSFIAIENIDSLDTKKELLGYDCVIIDEFHHAGSKSYRELNKKSWNNIYYRLGLTATPYRTNHNEKILLESVLAEVIYQISYKESIEQNYIVPLEVYYYEVPKIKIESFNYADCYNKLVLERSDLNGLICDTIKSLYNANKATLVLVKRISHGELLKSILEGLGLIIPFANGTDEQSNQYIKQFNSGAHPILIASSIVGEGVDTKIAEYVILAGGTGKSKTQIMQNLGRVFRNFPGKESGKAIVFKDGSHKWFREHFSFFGKVLKEEYGLEAIKL